MIKPILKNSTFSINIFESKGETFVHIQSQNKLLESVQSTLIQNINQASTTNEVLRLVASTFNLLVKGSKNVK